MIDRTNVLVFVFVKTPAPKVLLMKRTQERGGFWQPISGGIEPSETLDDALRRELYEETGIRGIVRILNLDYSYTHDTPKNGIMMHQQDICYAVEVQEQIRIVLSNEHIEYRWSDLQEVRSLLVWNPALEALIKLEKVLTAE
ncbi:MAG: NUDIX pyrophosphatase [Promethearchaeota archaeon]